MCAGQGPHPWPPGVVGLDGDSARRPSGTPGLATATEKRYDRPKSPRRCVGAIAGRPSLPLPPVVRPAFPLRPRQRGGEVRRAAASAHRAARRVTGCVKASRSACRNWRGEAVAPARPYSGSPSTGWPMASRWARIWCVRPVSSRTRSSVVAGSARSTSKCVIASRGSSVSVERRVRTRRSRPSGASIVPAARRRAARRPARGTRASTRARRAGLSAAWNALGARDDEQARTCRGPAGARCPGRSGSSPPATRPASACASVPRRWPRAGCTTTPAGLSTTSRCSSS